MEVVVIIICVYWLMGIYIMTKSQSRGLRADFAFTWMWGIHMVQHLRGKE